MSIKIPLKVRLHQGLGRGRFEARFVRLLSRFGGCRMIDMIDRESWPAFSLDQLPCSVSQN
jgi:hypothetical protein